MSAVADLLGCRYPIIQGAMAHISNPELVAAVSEAGGFGVLASGPITDPDELTQQIKDTQKLTDKPFGVNLIGFNPISMVFAEVVVETGLQAVTMSAGFSQPIIDYLCKHHVKILQVVPNVKSALKAEAARVDVIIAEGMESGGAQGARGVSTMVLIPLVADAVKLPVVAAGGIADVRGYRAALALGADGVQMGTRFFASQECIGHINCKAAICQAGETDTTLIAVENFFARVLRKAATEDQQTTTSEEVKFFSSRPVEVFLKGNLDAGWVAAGQIAGMVKEIQSVQEIIAEMVR